MTRRRDDIADAFPSPNKDIPYGDLRRRSEREPWHAMPDRPGQPATLAQTLKAGRFIVARCKGCDREARVDMQALIQRFGPDFRPGAVIERFSAALKCVKCGWRGARVEFRQPAEPSQSGFHRGHV